MRSDAWGGYVHGASGTGIATAVGMALAERMLAAEFNRGDLNIVDHRTWVFLGDGCLMEGVSQEACSLAGTLGLGKLIALYDDNGISIDGKVANWFADDTPARFEACGWRVLRNVDGLNGAAVDAAIREALTHEDKPTLICCRTVIGYGAPHKAGTSGVHGSPLGAEEAAETKAALGWKYDPFTIPQKFMTHGMPGLPESRLRSRGTSCSPAIRQLIPNWPKNSFAG